MRNVFGFPPKIWYFFIMLAYFRKINKYQWILFAIIAIGAFLRLYNLGDQSLWIDESFSALAAQKTAEHGIPLLDSGRMYSGTLPHTYLLAGLIKLFGTSEFILRFPSAIFGTLSIILIYIFSSRIFKNRVIGLITAAFMAFGYFDVAWSRQIRMYAEAQFFYLLSLYFFYRYLTDAKSSWKPLILAGLAGFIAILTHKLCLFIFPAYLIFLIFCKPKISKLVSSLSVFISLLILSVILFGDMGFLSSIWGRFSSVQFYIYDYSVFIFYNHFFAVILFFAGIFFAVREKNRDFFIFAGIFVAYLLLLSADNAVGMRYLFIFMPFLYTAAAYGLARLWQCKCPVKTVCHSDPPRRRGIPSIIGYYKGFLVVFFILAIWKGNFVLLPKTNYFLEYDPIKRGDIYKDYTPQPNFKAVYDVIKKSPSKNDVFIVAHSAIHEWYMPEIDYYRIEFDFVNRSSFKNTVIGSGGKKIDLYTGAPIIDTVETLQKVMDKKHGYIILDYFAMNEHINQVMVDYIKENNISVYYDQFNKKLPWTTVWVYRF